MARNGQRRFRLNGLEIQMPQWEALRILEPGWLLLKKDVWHYHTGHSLVKLGWIDVRLRGGYLMARLTPKGKEIRDAVWITMAERLDAVMGQKGTFNGQREYHGYNYGPRSSHSRKRW